MCSRSRGAPHLASTFVATLDPYEGKPVLRAVRRLPLETTDGRPFGDANVAIEATLAGGSMDLIVAADVENPLGITPSAKPGVPLVQRDWHASVDGEFAIIRRRRGGKITSLVLGRCRRVEVGDLLIELAEAPAFVELAVERDQITVLAGAASAVTRAQRSGRALKIT